jgi:hypothetical protein
VKRYRIKAVRVLPRNNDADVFYYFPGYNWHTRTDGAIVCDKRQADTMQHDRQTVEDRYGSPVYRIEAEEVP